MDFPRYRHSATLLTDGRVLVAGGTDGGGSFQNSAEIYDPDMQVFTATASMPNARAGHTATALPDGRVLVVGGYGPSGALNAVDLYDPVTGNWASMAPLSFPRFGHTATLLGDGRILVTGGQISGQLITTEIYDPAINTWFLFLNMHAARSYHTAIMLLDGRVLLAAGGTSNVSAELLADGRSIVDAVPAPLFLGNPLVLTGQGFRGLSDASFGSPQASPTNYPLVQIRSLENGLVRWLQVDPSFPFTDVFYQSLPVQEFPLGYAFLTVFVNGVPGYSSLTRLLPNPGMEIVKAVTPASAGPGQQVTYTLTFTNTGAETAIGLVITDIIPVELTDVAYDSSVIISDTGAAPPYAWSVQALEPGQMGVITVTGELVQGLPGGTAFTNTAMLSALGGGWVLEAVVGVTVLNAPPQARDDSAMTDLDVPVVISVLSNDTDPNGDILTITQVTPPAHGTVIISGTSIIYTPTLGYSGPDAFTYLVADGYGATDSAMVSVAVAYFRTYLPLIQK
jgi:uncharacterized repeat protein (TIGR01451 family)